MPGGNTTTISLVALDPKWHRVLDVQKQYSGSVHSFASDRWLLYLYHTTHRHGDHVVELSAKMYTMEIDVFARICAFAQPLTNTICNSNTKLYIFLLATRGA